MKTQLLIVALAAFMAVPPVAATGSRRRGPLPEKLAAQIGDPSTSMVVHAQWPGARQLPVVERIVELREYGMGYGPVSSVLSFMISTVDDLPVDVDDISDVWFVSEILGGAYGAELWIDTTLDDEQLEQILIDGEWSDLGDGRFGLRPPAEKLAEFESELASLGDGWRPSEEDLADIRASIMAPTSFVDLTGDGWLEVSEKPETAVPSDVKNGSRKKTRESIDQEQAFPMSGLFDLNASTVIAVAFDLPDNDDAPDFDAPPSAPPKDSITDIRRRIAELRQQADPFAGGYLADFLVTVQDLDGALAIDVVARRPGGGGETESADFLEMLLLGARVMAGNDRELSRQLGYATVNTGTGEVRAECILNQSTLIESFEKTASRQIELRELYERLYELQQKEIEGR